MQTFYKHEPNKFQFFEDIKDNRGNNIGFSLDDKREYLFDESGGWMDFNGCYYNHNCDPFGWIILSQDRMQYGFYDMNEIFVYQKPNRYHTYDMEDFNPQIQNHQSIQYENHVNQFEERGYSQGEMQEEQKIQEIHTEIKNVKKQNSRHINPDDLLSLQGVDYDSKGLDHEILAFVKIHSLRSQDLAIRKSKLEGVAKITRYTFPQFFLSLWQDRENPLDSKLHLNDICTICQFELFDIDGIQDVKQIQLKHFQKDMVMVAMLECSHLYHLECLEMCVKEKHLQCAMCNRIYGVKEGDQPHGVMRVDTQKHMHCQGYEKYGTIIINYQMMGGQRGATKYYGTDRQCYLPDCNEGCEILRLLQIAFDRKLIFTIGTSVTSGRENQIVWNGIHHKTKLRGGSSNYGYPDETYLSRVRSELASKGVM